MGFYAQDSWRVRQNLTLNVGLRYELQLPFTALNNSYSNATIDDVWGVTGVGAGLQSQDRSSTNLGYLFQPGVLKGAVPTYDAVRPRARRPTTPTSTTSRRTSASAWTPPATEGGILGRSSARTATTVLRAGFTIAFQRNGMGDFSDVFGANPGIVIDATRSQSIGNLGAVPVLFRDPNSLYAPTIPESRTYPMPPPEGLQTGSVNIFDPDLQVPYARTWSSATSGRSARTMAVEVAVHRHAQLRRLDGVQLQRSQHHRERLPQRVQARSGEPAGQHRRRPRVERSSTSAPGPAPRRCRSTSRTSTACRRPRPATRRSTRRATSPATRSSIPWRSTIRRRSRRPPTWTARRRGGRTR